MSFTPIVVEFSKILTEIGDNSRTPFAISLLMIITCDNISVLTPILGELATEIEKYERQGKLIYVMCIYETVLSDRTEILVGNIVNILC